MTDITRSGVREYDDGERGKVLGAFWNMAGQGKAVHVDTLAKLSGVGGRTVRAVMVDADGDGDLLLGGGDEGYTVALDYEDAEALTRRLRATAYSLLERVQRREAAQAKMTRRQPVLL